jgi:hypothetical protein
MKSQVLVREPVLRVGLVLVLINLLLLFNTTQNNDNPKSLELYKIYERYLFNLVIKSASTYFVFKLNFGKVLCFVVNFVKNRLTVFNINQY